MPFAVLKSIREVSSEDKLHCASNLLRNEAGRKWKTAEPGEKTAYVIIEMDTEYSIKGIDIGNESSAFVEVLVGGPRCTRENFKEILITCSFMTPGESKVNSTPNRVRCFHREALVKEIASEKWKLLKIVCSQPFNNTINYGLSFIKIHVDEPGKSKTITGSSLVNRTVGSFNLREDSPDSESESATALFNRWKQARIKDPSAVSSVPRTPTAEVIKKTHESFITHKNTSVSTPSSKKDVSQERPVVPDRNRNALMFPDDDDDNDDDEDEKRKKIEQEKRKKKLERLEKAIAADRERVTKETEKNKKPKKQEISKKETKSEEKPANVSISEKNKTPKSAKNSNSPSTSGQRRPMSSPCVSDNPKKPKLDKPVQYKPFHQLLNGVVLVISGIQNPDRADLRNKALALGAKYKGDWDNTSTHLICAFKNTPKYNQVKGKGKIITRKWIEDCHSKKRKLPWRRYALDTAEAQKAESEDEILDESFKPPEEPQTVRTISVDSDSDILATYDNVETNHSQCVSSGSDTEDEIQRVLAKHSPQKKTNGSGRDVYEVSTEEEGYVAKRKSSALSGSDTEDEIQRVLAKHSSQKKTNGSGRDIYEVSTEEEDYVTKRKSASDKTSFFKNMKFYISDQLSATMKIKVERYIQGFSGILTTSMDEANYLIANELVNDVGEFSGETVSPLWITECYDMECLISTKRYLVK